MRQCHNPIAPGNLTESLAPLGPDLFRGPFFCAVNPSVSPLWAIEPVMRADKEENGTSCNSGVRRPPSKDVGYAIRTE